jgi:putative CocE/NonD family hydrolase
MYIGDDFHHNGAFRLSYGYEYASMMENGKENNPFKFGKYDTYDWYLSLGPLREANRLYLDGARPTWNNFVGHPNYDSFWQKQEVSQYMKNIRVPNLNVSGWFDQEDFYGPWKIYREAEKTDSAGVNHIVIGPWNHGGWSRGDGRLLGKLDFGSDTAKYFRQQVQAPWFAYWLKDKGKLQAPEILSFETGANEWKQYSAWPPKGVKSKNLYFRDGGKLSFDAPSDDAFDEFLSDPARPVPYRNRPIPPTFTAQGWSTWLLDDQRFADSRPDVLVWQTDVLTEDVTVTGDVVVKFFASTTESDADWIVKLIDVLPEATSTPTEMSGYEWMIAADVLRGRFRDGFDKPKPMKPGEPTPFQLELLAHDHKFQKGHRIMVQLQSTWFPVIDRNPQRYVPNIFEAKAADFKKATHRIYRSPKLPSHVVLPVMGN